MSKQEHFLNIRLAGRSIGSGRIPISQLMRLFGEFNKVLTRVGKVLLGESDSIRRGRVQSSIKDEISLDLVEITQGNPQTVLGLERSMTQQTMEGMDFGLEIIEKSLDGLSKIQAKDEDLPSGFDPGVLLAWRDLGVMFELGVSDVTFSLNHRSIPLKTVYTMEGYHRVQEKIQGPMSNIRTIEGRLLMADFKEHGTRCRIHPSFGDPVMCLFNESQKDEVLENILCFVKVIGEAKEDPVSGKITSIKIHDIQRLENREEERLDLIPQGTPLPTDFWQSPSLDFLAEEQNIKPMEDISELFGSWPGDPEDGFEEMVNNLRKRNVPVESRP